MSAKVIGLYYLSLALILAKIILLSETFYRADI